MWSLRASDIYQGGETEPNMLTEPRQAAHKTLDNGYSKNYAQVVALNVRAHVKTQIQP